MWNEIGQRIHKGQGERQRVVILVVSKHVVFFVSIEDAHTDVWRVDGTEEECCHEDDEHYDVVPASLEVAQYETAIRRKRRCCGRSSGRRYGRGIGYGW